MPDIFISDPEKTPTPVSSDEARSSSAGQAPASPSVPVTPNEFPTPEGIEGGPRRHGHHRLSAFALYPDDVHFETKDKEEKIILMLRQHPIVNVKWIFFTILLLTGPTLLGVFGVFSYLPTGFSLVLSLSWYLVTSAYAIEGFLNWYFNVYFVTTNRVVDVDFYNLINKRVSDAEIEKIQDVSYSLGGVLRTVLNYGDVFIQTAAEVSEFKFEAVPNPEKVTKVLDDLIRKV